MDTSISVRIDSELRQQFVTHCESNLNRKYSDVLRELIQASVDGRLSITPTKAQKDLYK